MPRGLEDKRDAAQDGGGDHEHQRQRPPAQPAWRTQPLGLIDVLDDHATDPNGMPAVGDAPNAMADFRQTSPPPDRIVVA